MHKQPKKNADASETFDSELHATKKLLLTAQATEVDGRFSNYDNKVAKTDVDEADKKCC